MKNILIRSKSQSLYRRDHFYNQDNTLKLPTSLHGGPLFPVYFTNKSVLHFPRVPLNSQYQPPNSLAIYRASGEILVVVLKSGFIN